MCERLVISSLCEVGFGHCFMFIQASVVNITFVYFLFSFLSFLQVIGCNGNTNINLPIERKISLIELAIELH